MENMTIVTAVSGDKYIKKFERGINNWHYSSLLQNCRFIVFVDNKSEKKVKDIVAKFSYLYNGEFTVITWEIKYPEFSKESILLAFILGVSDNVMTKYWCKLDCDCTLKIHIKESDLPNDWWKHTMVASPWGYTKIKGDPEFEKTGYHWLNKLDDFCDKIPDFRGTQRLFQEKIKTIKYNHKRICSFFTINRTSWTRHHAKILNEYNNGRMIIPSEDTSNYYLITRLGNGRSILKFKFRQYFNTR